MSASVVAQFPPPRQLVFLGFSQGAAMAYRAAAGSHATGLIALGGDVPPEVVEARPKLPPVLIGRGIREEWYTDEKLQKDLRFLREVTTVSTCVFDGGARMDGRIPRGGGGVSGATADSSTS